MIERWITLSAKDVHVIFPLGIFDKDIEIVFRTPEAIDSAIDQLKRIKQNLEQVNNT